jgi:aldehyde:ferredoxin oxidoreductase
VSLGPIPHLYEYFWSSDAHLAWRCSAACQAWATSRRPKRASAREVGPDILQTLGRKTLRLEREFNRHAGFTAADDRLPEWMTREPSAPQQAVFDVAESDLDSIFAEI